MQIEPRVIGGVRTEYIRPRSGVASANRARILINLHGGAFMWGDGSGYGTAGLCRQLAQRCGPRLRPSALAGVQQSAAEKGRPAVSGLTVLAVDLGGSHASCAVLSGGSIMARTTVPASGNSPLREQLPTIGRGLHHSLEIAGLGQDSCSAVVLGFCGIVNAREKRVLTTNDKFDDAPRLDLERWCAHEFTLPFLLENDARLALLGESTFGAAKGAEDAVMSTLGSGIGAAAMLNGRLLQGMHGLAGMIGGHLPIALDGRLCCCGNLGCAETEASTEFLPQIYRDRSATPGFEQEWHTQGFAELFAAVDAGDPAAVRVLDHCIRAWSVLSVALIYAYDPEVVVFGAQS